MKTLNSFRCEFYSVLLIFLVTFISCGNHLDQDLDTVELKEVELFAKKHVELTIELSKLLNDESRIEFEFFRELSENIEFGQLEDLLKDNNFKNFNKISTIILEIHENTTFLSKNFDSNLVENIVSIEFDNQYFSSSLRGPCHDAHHKGQIRCLRNFAIASAACLASGIFSFGVSTAIGYTAALTVYTLCNIDNDSDLQDCLN